MLERLERLSLAQYLAKPWERPELILGDWLPTSGICMLFGPRGGGKTFVTLGLAMHVAAGWRFLDFQCPKARRVLYVDGEMNAADVAKRLRKIEEGMGPFPSHTFENLQLLSHELFERGIPDLSEAGAGRRLIERNGADCELIILDNLSCLMRDGDENAAESWHSINEWLLSFRRKHQSVLCIHHSGKPNSRGEVNQRGTSKREDAMNSSVKLVTLNIGPPLQIHWEYTKVRSFTPKPAQFELEVAFGRDAAGEENSAEIRLADNPMDEIAEVMALQADGLSQREMAERIGVSATTINRRLRKAKRTAVSR